MRSEQMKREPREPLAAGRVRVELAEALLRLDGVQLRIQALRAEPGEAPPPELSTHAPR